MQVTTTAKKRKATAKLFKPMPAERQLRYEEVRPDDWDMVLLKEAKEENNGSVISLEKLAEDLGFAL